MKSRRTILSVGALLCFSGSLCAGSGEADESARAMAAAHAAKGFSIMPTGHAGVLREGEAVRFLLPVTKGLDYVLLAGVDAAGLDADLYVNDEAGTLIAEDRRKLNVAGLQFRATYSGSVQVCLHMARAEGGAGYCVLVGRRGR